MQSFKEACGAVTAVTTYCYGAGGGVVARERASAAQEAGRGKHGSWKLSPDFVHANLSRYGNYASLLRWVIFSPTQVSMQAYNTFYYGNFTGSAVS